MLVSCGYKEALSVFGLNPLAAQCVIYFVGALSQEAARFESLKLLLCGLFAVKLRFRV